MTIFSPDDLKNKWPNKYSHWTFAKNGKDEWVGCYKNQHGIIISKSGTEGSEYPDIEKREITELIPAGSGGIWYGLFRLFKKK